MRVLTPNALGAAPLNEPAFAVPLLGWSRATQHSLRPHGIASAGTTVLPSERLRATESAQRRSSQRHTSRAVREACGGARRKS